MINHWNKKKMTLRRLHIGAMVGICAVLSGGVWAQDNDKDTTEVGKKAASPSVGGTEMKADQKFLMMAAQGNIAEIEMAQLAKQKAPNNNQVQNYAQRIIEDHTTANNKVMQIMAKKGLTMPKTPPADAMAMMKKMKGMSGAKFAKMYMQDMIKDHTKDIADYSNEAKHGYDDDIKGYAVSTLPTLQSHLQFAQTLSNPTSKTNMNGNKYKTGKPKM